MLSPVAPCFPRFPQARFSLPQTHANPPTHTHAHIYTHRRRKLVLDNAVKDKTCAHFAAAFQLELFFEEVEVAFAAVAAGQPFYLEFDRDGHDDEHDDTG